MFFANSSDSDLSKEAQTENFRAKSKVLIDYICDYSKKQICHDVEPGYLRPLFPENPPDEQEDFRKILQDFDEKVMPGVMHWRHPDFYAYFNCGNALPNILGDLLSTACGGIGCSWKAQAAVIGIEKLMMDSIDINPCLWLRDIITFKQPWYQN